MIQRKKKQLKIVLLILLIIAALVAGAWGICNVVNNKSKAGQGTAQDNLSEFNVKSLIVETKLSEVEIKGRFQAGETEILMDGEGIDTNLYLLKYNTAEETKNAYEKLKKDEKIENVDLNKDITLKDETSKVFKNKDIILSNEINQIFRWVIGDDGTVLTSWGPYAMGLDETLEKINTKADAPEIIVAVIDSGIDMRNDAFKNETLKARVMEGYDATKQSDATDNDGHGTNVAGIILESTPNNVKILPIKALEKGEDGNTTGTLSSIITAINYAIEQEADIINMSLGSDEAVAIERNAINRAYKKGITSIVASGNGDERGNGLNLDLPDNECYPAEFDNVITVGAVRNKLIPAASTGQLSSDFRELLNNYSTYIKATAQDLTIAQFSNYGKCIDFVAPGVLIVGLTKGAGATIASYDGTSQATPHVSAAAATVKSYNKEYTSDQIEEILQYYAEDLGDEGKDIIYGNGIVSFKDFEECECGTDKCDKIYCFGCDDTDCLFHKGKTSKLESIEVTKEPNKTEYTEGEEFDKTGMVVTAKYSDGTTKDVSDYTCSSIIDAKDESNSEDNEYGYTVDITYTEDNVTRHTTQDIIIKKEIKLETNLTSIEITTPPTSTLYEVFDDTTKATFDKTGMVVTAKYSDNTSKIVTDYTCNPMEITADIFTIQEGDDRIAEITISYAEKGITKTAVQRIKQAKAGGGGETTDAKLSGLKITTPPAKTTYEVGETFDKSGMVVTAVYSDGTERLVDKYTIEPDRTLTINDSKVTVSYTEGGITKVTEQKITVKAKQNQQPPNSQDNQQPTPKKVLSKITAAKKPNKTTYKVGETFDVSGMIINAIYEDGTDKAITDYTYSPSRPLETTDTKIEISYKEDGVTKSLSIPITVQAASSNKNTSNANSSTNANNNNNSSDNDGPGLGSSMFEVTDGNGNRVGGTTSGDGQSGTGQSGTGQSGTGQSGTGQSGTAQSGTTQKDGTTSESKLANTGLEDNIIVVAVSVISLIMIISYAAYRRYKDI